MSTKKMKNKNKKAIMEAEPAFNPHECEPVPDSSDKKEELNSSPFSTLWVHYKPWHEPLIKDVDWTQERSWTRVKSDTPLNSSVIQKLRDLSRIIYKDELEAYDKYERQHGGREVADREKMLKTGAKADKWAQMAAKIIDDPVHSLNFLEELVNALEKDKDRALHQLKVEFTGMFKSVLRGVTVAIPFDKQNLSTILTPLVRKNFTQQAYKDLVCWHFLDSVATLYTRMVNFLSKILQTGDANSKVVAIDLLAQLLGDHPNQDTDLIIEILVNKLGDIEKKVASKCCYRLKEIINQRRKNLKSKTVDKCGEFLYRANMKQSAKVRVMGFLNEMIFKIPADVPVMKKVLSLYYGFFTVCIKEGDVNTKMISHVLTGIKRTINFLMKVESDRSNYQFLVDQQNVLFKMLKLTHFKVSVQVLKLLFDILPLIEKQGPLVERFECILYEFVLHKEFGDSTFTKAFLNVVYKSMVKMVHHQAVNAFAKRLLQVAFNKPKSHVCIAIMYLVIQVSYRNPILKEYIRNSIQGEKKELVEEKTLPLASVVSNIANGADSDDDEKFDDLDIDETGKTVVINGEVKTEEGAATWLHRGDGKGIVKSVDQYLPLKKNPRYCGVNHTKLFELCVALKHYHPTIRSFANSLLKDEPLSYKGQPFSDFTAKSFLDKFVHKQPKKAKKFTVGTNTALGSKAHYQPEYLRDIPVNSKEFLNKRAEIIPPDLLFFHQFYNISDKKKKKSSRSEINDDEFDEYLERAGGRDGAVQLGFDDVEDSDEELDFASSLKKKEEREESDDEDAFGDFDNGEMEESDEEDMGDGEVDMMQSDDDCDEYSDDDDIFATKTSETLKKKSEKKKKIESLKKEKKNRIDSLNGKKTDNSKKRKLSVSNGTSKKAKASNEGTGLEQMMVDADEYFDMFQEYQNRAPQVTSEDFINTDKLSAKQMKWEKRNVDGKGKSKQYVSRKKGQGSKKISGRGRKK